ncbi:MAG: SCP2 sterol-binding domain-containing protein [Psychromonas sp.]|nr:SCP2 sterol-binding domain-containing protein [Psychromonas sp.]
MSLDNLACAFFEMSLNKLQQLDLSSKTKRKQLENKIIGIVLKELNKPLYFVISMNKIDILSQFQGQCDCLIHVSLHAISELKNNNQFTTLIKNGQLDIEGDIEIAQQFAQLMTKIDIDYEEHLSHLIGDIFAHQLCRFFASVYKYQRKKLTHLSNHSANLITDELKIAPSRIEVAHFCEQVEDLNDHLLQIDSSIQKIIKKYD